MPRPRFGVLDNLIALEEVLLEFEDMALDEDLDQSSYLWTQSGLDGDDDHYYLSHLHHEVMNEWETDDEDYEEDDINQHEYVLGWL